MFSSVELGLYGIVLLSVIWVICVGGPYGCYLEGV